MCGSTGLNSQSACVFFTPVLLFIVAIAFLSLKDMIAIIKMGGQKSHADWLFNPAEPHLCVAPNAQHKTVDSYLCLSLNLILID